jgi:hypothetical protein
MFRMLSAAVVLGLLATAGAYAAPRFHVVDRTYSCRVRPQHYVDVDASVSLPPFQGRPQPGQVWLDTVHKTAPVGGLETVVPQVEIDATTGRPRIDKSLCRPSSRRVALKPAGLPLYETVTQHHLGRIDARCAAAKRVLVRFRITLTGGKPEKALFGIRNDATESRPIEFVKWSPSKVSGYLGNGCTDTG